MPITKTKKIHLFWKIKQKCDFTRTQAVASIRWEDIMKILESCDDFYVLRLRDVREIYLLCIQNK